MGGNFAISGDATRQNVVSRHGGVERFKLACQRVVHGGDAESLEGHRSHVRIGEQRAGHGLDPARLD
jgi:hypothetical protein